ncbi:hypothetical protein HDU96_004584 [Phlyctochytrium bullatum]|nr:hypothetical protein HDU96_004584 [Phlyctochytrium bullatum]
MKVLAVGSVKGAFESFFSKVSAINKKHGPFDLIICTGDFFGKASPESLEKLTKGEFKVPVSTYIIRGASVFPDAIRERLASNDNEICENVFYLGSFGTYATSQGLRIAYLSGIYDANEHGVDLDDSNRESKSYYDSKAIDTLLSAKGSNNQRPQHRQAPPPKIDILVTYEWPENIVNGSHLESAALVTAKVGALNGAVPPIAELAAYLQPRYHFAGKINIRSKTNLHRSLALYPPNTTESPFSSGLDKKRKRENEANRRRITFAGYARSQGIGCRIARRKVLGPTRTRQETSTHRSHHVRDCPKKKAPVARDITGCWFCLSNPKLEKHLIVDIGSEVYIALAKGGLSEWGGHLLIVPLGHFSSMGALRASPDGDQAIKEVDKLKREIEKAFSAKGYCTVYYETYSGAAAPEAIKGVQHTHIQTIPILKEHASKIVKAFEEGAAKESLDIVSRDGRLPENMSAPYLCFDVPSTDGGPRPILVLSPSFDKLREMEDLAQEALAQGKAPPRLFDINFGRRILAELCGLPDRVDWKDCILSEEEEKAQTEKIRELLNIED